MKTKDDKYKKILLSLFVFLILLGLYFTFFGIPFMGPDIDLSQASSVRVNREI